MDNNELLNAMQTMLKSELSFQNTNCFYGIFVEGWTVHGDDVMISTVELVFDKYDDLYI